MGDPEPERARPETLTRRVFEAAEHREIPLGTIVAAVAVVTLTGITLTLAWVVRADLLLFALAAFVAVLLSPAVDAIERRRVRRSIATSIVFGAGVLVFCGITYALGEPLVAHVRTFAQRLPDLVNNAKHGTGWIGSVVNRLHLHNWLVHNAPKLNTLASHLAGPALSFGSAAFNTIFRLVLIAVTSFFLLLDLPRIWRGFLGLLPEQHAARIGVVAKDASSGVTGYMVGNILTSLLAGIVVLVTLLIFGVPFAGLLALWVALVDLLPIVGALLAGIPTVLVAFLHSSTAGIGTLVVFLVYQQIENHVLNPIVMARTVKMSPLLNLIAVVIGATLGGRVAGVFGTFFGALVGIPVGSALQVIVRSLRHGDLLAPTSPRGEVGTGPPEGADAQAG